MYWNILWLVSESDVRWLVPNWICIFFKKNTNTMSIMVKIVIVMASPRQLWSKPTWCCIWNFKIEETPRRLWTPTDVVVLFTISIWEPTNMVMPIHFTIFSEAPRQFLVPNWCCVVSLTSVSRLNRRGVDCLTDVMFNVALVNVGSGLDDKSLPEPTWKTFSSLVSHEKNKKYT